ncbi:Thioredoxin family protein [Prochlorococcus marinus str. MIT 9302]|uniref:Thioredoxin family protein n=1 Tax=Prochlorococcus marinus str. MIT 9302 TaxID=74545 RepID=A0A0A2ADA9_PROMR|nr:Thioredoxin family protein [Prochlorococcus marinus str. MIT 9302]
MKIIQWILIALIFLSPYKANANRDTDSYDGNIFPIYAGNGAIVPPKTTLKDSLNNKRVSVLFFYLDDSSDSKAMSPVISGLDLIWRENIDIIALTTDELQNEEKSDLPTEPNFYWNGLIPQTIIIDSNGQIKFDKNGMADFGEMNKIISQSTGIERDKSSTFTVEAFNEYNSTISETKVQEVKLEEPEESEVKEETKVQEVKLEEPEESEVKEETKETKNN